MGVDFLKASDAQHKIDVQEIVIIKTIDTATPVLSKLIVSATRR